MIIRLNLPNLGLIERKQWTNTNGGTFDKITGFNISKFSIIKSKEKEERLQIQRERDMTTTCYV